ncbi:MAG: M15 family metallopeptidase [Proteobacteria bacterium]|nr:M15 family metallopeptidase [Pseudomonadota bacterium]
MKRRYVLKALGLSCIGFGISPNLYAKSIRGYFAGKNYAPRDNDLKDYLHKIQNFNEPHKDDILLAPALVATFESTLSRLKRLQKLVGHGNYNILNFKHGLALAKNYPDVGKFTKEELQFMETVFYADGQQYGFLGKKPLKEITDQVNKKDVIKIPYSGNYLYKERSVELYEEIKKELGDQVILTSGIRSVMKQFLLFLNKVHDSNGNLSLASRSLAPPGYSFHGNGDFDVGQAGYGKLNFTGKFTETEVYKRLAEMGYLKLRYPADNRLGVRFEPWHIKISDHI